MLPTVARRESAPRKAQTEAEARLAAAGDAAAVVAAAAAEGLRYERIIYMRPFSRASFFPARCRSRGRRRVPSEPRTKSPEPRTKFRSSEKKVAPLFKGG